VITAEEETPAPPVAAAPAEDEEQPRRWHLRAAGGAAVIIAATALVRGLGGHGALVTAGIVAAAAVVVLVLWRLPHLRRHFARPRGIRPWKSGRQPLSLSQGRRRGLLPGFGRRAAAGGGARRGGPSGSRAPVPGRPAPKGLRGRLPSWVPGSARRRGPASTAGGSHAGKPGRLARVLPAPVRKALAKLRKPGSVAAQRKAAQAGAAAAKAKPAAGKPGSKPADGKKAEAKDAKPGDAEAKAGGEAAGAEPPPEPERQPGTAIEPDKTETSAKARSRNMSAAGMAAEAVHEHVGSYEPESGTDLDLFLGELGPLYESLGAAMGHLADRLGSEFPVHPAVIEHLHEIAATTAGLSEFAAEAHAIHRVAHAKELERIEEPRPNEGLWDVTQQ
jgi:hypothetical protein